MATQNNIFDVIVVGAGPCGIATTKALTKVIPQIKIMVLEARSEYKKGVGAVINLAPNGQKALEAIDQNMFQAVMKSFSPSAKALITLDNNDEELRYQTIDSNKKSIFPGEENQKQITKAIGWSEHTQLILESLGSFQKSVMFGAKCQDLTILPDEQKPIQVSLRDGTTYSSKYLIGCDGYFSQVRKALYKEEHDPPFDDTIFWRGRFPLDSFKTLKDLKYDYTTSMVQGFGDGIVSIASPISQTEGCLVIGVKSSLLRKVGLDDIIEAYESGYAQNKKRPLGIQEQVASNDPKITYNNCKRAVSVFSNSIQQILNLISPDKLTEHGIYQTSPDKFDEGYFTKDNVVLLGDACHPGRPTGQGLNMALEDAAFLGLFVKKYGLNMEAFQKFAHFRTPRIIQTLKYQKIVGQGSYDLKQVREMFSQQAQDNKQQATPIQDNKMLDFFYDIEIEAL